MTGGRVVVLGATGRNFAACMSGGIAYVWDPGEALLANCNLGMVELEKVEADDDMVELRNLIEKHRDYTGSAIAIEILSRWERSIPHFVKVMPTDYKRVLDEKKVRGLHPDHGQGCTSSVSTWSEKGGQTARAQRPKSRSVSATQAAPATGSTHRKVPDCPKCPKVAGALWLPVQCGLL